MANIDLVKRGARRLGAAEQAALRLAARLAYLHETAQPSLGELSQRPEFARAGLARLADWACQEEWDGQRALEEGRRQDRAREQASQAYRRTHARRLRQLDALHEEAARWRSHPRLQPRSWEAVAAVQLRAAQLAHQMSQPSLPAAGVAPQATEESRAEPASHQLGAVSSGEALEAAHHILRQRLAHAGPPAEAAEAPPALDAGIG